MFLVVGITGQVGGATARHLLARGKKVRALVRDRAKAASWTDQGVELVDGDWNNAAAIERALGGVDGAFVMLPAVWAPSLSLSMLNKLRQSVQRGARFEKSPATEPAHSFCQIFRPIAAF